VRNLSKSRRCIVNKGKVSYPLVQPAVGALVRLSMSMELLKSVRREGKEAHWHVRRQMQ